MIAIPLEREIPGRDKVRLGTVPHNEYKHKYIALKSELPLHVWYEIDLKIRSTKSEGCAGALAHAIQYNLGN